jgi:hypothetical protein
MHSTLNPKPTDDPHDIVAVAPDDVRVAPAEEELSNLLRQAARHHSPQPTHARSDLAAAPVPPVDTTFRPAAADVQLLGRRRWIGRGAVRAFTALLLAACISVAGIAWQSDAAKKMIAKLATQLVLIASLAPEKSGPSAQPAAPAAPAVAAADASAAAPQPTAPAQSAPQAVAPAAAAPSADSALLQSMARDLASAGQEIEQLKASIEQLKASQQQMSRDIAKASDNKASEQNPRARILALPPRPVAARMRRPMPSYPLPQAAAAPALPPAAAPYYAPRQTDYAPRQGEPPPQTTAPPLTDPELASVPRPPMPVR